MKIELRIESENAVELQEVLATLAGAVRETQVSIVKPADIKKELDNTYFEPEVLKKPKDDEPKDEPKTPAQIRKEELAAEIEALGGTAPDRGSVAKFEEALAELKAKLEDGPTEDVNPPETTDETTDETPATETAGEICLDDVRTLAHALVKSTPDNPVLGKTKLGECLKKVGAQNLTGATPAQLTAIVPLLEANLGKTLSQVLSETN